MKLTVLGSGSSGNSYILTDKGGDSLVIEIGLNFPQIQKHFKQDLYKISGVLVTHEHGDHNKAINKVLYYGLNVYATAGTFKGSKVNPDLEVNAKVIKYGEPFFVGNFGVMPFDVQHDVNEPCGFVISHKESGNILFLTDTTYCKYNFNNLDHIICEANYCEDLLDESVDEEFLRRRIIKSHLSIQNVELMLARWDIKSVKSIILTHLSERNANPEDFKNRIISKFGKTTEIALKGSVFNLDLNPF